MEKTIILPVEMRLPESVGAAVRKRAEATGFATPDEYVQTLVMADLDRAGDGEGPREYPELSPETLAKLQAGLDSVAAGRVVTVDEAFWEEMHRRVWGPKSGA